MKKTTTLLLAFLLLLASNTLSAQSKAISQFEEQVDGYNLFLYQSLIRVLNQDKNEDFNMLIKDLDHLKFLMTDSIGSESRTLYTELMTGLEEEGYEELMNFDNKDYKATVFSSDSGKSGSSWVVIFNMGEMSGLFEMMGEINMEYMHAMSSIDYNKLKEMMPMIKDIGESFPDIDENETEDWDE